MKRKNNLDEALNALELASTLADDGAVQSAIEQAEDAIGWLKKEQKRRNKLASKTTPPEELKRYKESAP